MSQNDAKIRGDDIRAAGIGDGPAMGDALRCMPRAVKALGREGALESLRLVAADPTEHSDDLYFSAVAERLLAAVAKREARFIEREAPAPFANFCPDAEAGALQQMNNCLRLPSAIAGAMMPDAHQGYGLPIGGVLKTKGTIIPFAVGVDIACSISISILDVDPEVFETNSAFLEQALLKQTTFGIGAGPELRADHPVLEDERWKLTSLARSLQAKGWAQLGSSGTSNHFVEFGTLILAEPDMGLEPGKYVALLSHSGSRGVGAQIAGHYSKLARTLHPELPKELIYLSWLDLDHESGQEYLALMRLMGDYAAGCHEVIHERVTQHLKAEILAGAYNRHNFAWTEEEDGEQMVIHRKGATPAGKGVLGVIPGSMADPGFVVRGKGEESSLQSSSHGAGRAMSRTAAREKFTWSQVRPLLEERGVKLLSAGIDENPLCYKPIAEVMANQESLIDIVARFDPRIVRMADAKRSPRG